MGPFGEKELVACWSKLKTYFDRERMREEGSKVSGTGTSKVRTFAKLVRRPLLMFTSCD